jgi:hypothetical protein
VRHLSPTAPPSLGALAAVAVLALGGCGLGAGRTPRAVQLTVTRDFGAHPMPLGGPLRVSGEETVMSLLIRNYTVTTRYGGGFVQSIDGFPGGQEGARPIDWFYYDNGIQAPKGAAATNVHPGDRIWWDRHDWSQTEDVHAVVGSFPEPFLSGIAGKRLPVRIECVRPGGFACDAVKARMRKLAIPAAVASLTSSTGTPDTLRVLVGVWKRITADLGARDIERGPRASGVYARFSADGQTLTPLDQDGHPLSSLHAGTGLIAATKQGEDAPVWLITGTDGTGVNLAARSLTDLALHDHFAVAVTAAGVVPLPEPTG